MLDFELQTKLEDCLKKGGFEYDFSIDDNYYFDRSYGKYTSLTLKSITGLLNNSILNNDSEHSSYNIDLINRITKCLIDSNDIKLKNIAWNSFIDCAYDERFILFDEMKKATRHFAKRQITWYKKMPYIIKWYDADKLSYENLLTTVIKDCRNFFSDVE